MIRKDFHIFRVENKIFFTFWTIENVGTWYRVIVGKGKERSETSFSVLYSGKDRKAHNYNPYIDYGRISWVFVPKKFLLWRREWQILKINNNRLGLGEIEGELLNISIFLHDYKPSASSCVDWWGPYDGCTKTEAEDPALRHQSLVSSL